MSHTVIDAPPFECSDELKAEIKRLKTQYPDDKSKSVLIRVLHLAQEANAGWLSVPAMDAVAAELALHPIEVYEVATFYSMYNHQPVGKYVMEFCHTGPCALVGVEKLMAYTANKLGISVGETTTDGMFTIKGVECLGACGYGPMMQVGEFYHEHLNEAKIDTFIENCRAGKINKGTWRMDKA